MIEITPPAPPKAADANLAARGHDRRWLILATLSIAQLMVVLDSTVVNIALPSAQHDLSFSNGDRQWIVTAYSLAFGALVLLGGRLGDMFGVRRTFLIGLVGFAAASAVGGAANGFAMLVIARAVQGAFGALLAPSVLSLLTTTFSGGRERAKAMGIYGAVVGSGAAIGLLLGGVLTEYLSWRWCMYVNLVFAVIAFVGGISLVASRATGKRRSLDVPGTILAVGGLFCLVFGFSEADRTSWGHVTTIVFLIVGVVLLAAFVLLEARVAHPLLPLRIVLDRNRAGGYLGIFAVGLSMFGVFLFLTYFLQLNLGFSPVWSGVAFLPTVAAIVITSQVGTRVLAGLIGPRWIVGPGLLIAAAGMFLLSRIEVSSGYAGGVLPGLIVFGAGLGMTMAAAMNNATQRVEPEEAGVASALVNASQQVGGSIGTAVLTTIASSAATGYVAGHARGAQTAALAALHSYHAVFLSCTGILLVGMIVIGLLMRGRVTAAPTDAEPVAL